MESNAIHNGHEQEAPVRTARCLCGVAVVVDGEEDVCCFAEVGEGVADGGRVGGLHQQVGYRGAEEDDVRELIGGEIFVLEVSAAC